MQIVVDEIVGFQFVERGLGNFFGTDLEHSAAGRGHFEGHLVVAADRWGRLVGFGTVVAAVGCRNSGWGGVGSFDHVFVGTGSLWEALITNSRVYSLDSS